MQVAGQEGFADLRPLFKGKKYFGVDYRIGLGVDMVADITNLRAIEDNSVGTVICCDTFEHICNPFKAISELKRISKGMVIITSVMNFPIHSYPHDFYRYTPQGFEYLLSDFEHSQVISVGRHDFPHTVIGIASNKSFNTLDLTEYEKKWYNQQTKSQMLLSLYVRMKRRALGVKTLSL